MTFMLTMSLMAAPALAVADTAPQSSLTINGAIENATYKIVPLMTLTTSGEVKDENGVLSSVAGYTYKLADNAVGEAVKAVISNAEFGFAAQIDSSGAVTRTGFQLADNGLVVFRVAQAADQTVDAAYQAWTASSDGQVFMSKFADKVKAALEAENFNLDSFATAVKDNDTRDENPDKGAIKVTLDYGYYMVISGAGQRAIINTNPMVGGGVINEKNQAPGLTKQVWEDADSQYHDKSDAAIGDLVYFEATIDAQSGMRHMRFEDTLSDGLDFVALTDVSFYPRSANGEGYREVYLNAMAGATNLDKNGNPTGTTMLPAKSSDKFDWAGDDLKGISLENPLSTLYIDATRNGRTLTVDFDEIWLMSKRSDVNQGTQPTDRGAYTFDPIYPNDTRVSADNPTAADYAKYNQYLGDMATTADDGGEIVIKYVARLNANAKIGETGNENTAVVKYGNDPDVENGPSTPEVNTHTYVYELDVLKHMMGDEATVLKGAQFELRRAGEIDYDFDKDAGTITVGEAVFGQVDAAQPLQFVKQDDGSYKVKTDDVTGEATTVLESDTNGKIRIKGLDADLYALKETKAPDGYILAEKPVYAILGGVFKETAAVNGENIVTMSVYVQDKTTATQFNAVKDEGGLQINQVAIANASGLVMPSTGGIGTTIFYIVGGALILGAGVLLVVKKRVGHGEE